MYLSFYCKGSKRVTQGLHVRGSWRLNITATFWPSLLWPSALCLSRSPGLLNRWPALCWLSLLHLISNFSGPQLFWLPTQSGAPRAPLTWCGFPYHISSITPTVWFLSLLSYIIVQLATQSLEWHVWSSSSGNNSHAVQRSLSSRASVYECIMGCFPCPILLARSTYTIFPHKCHRNVSLPFRCITLEWQVWPGWRSKYNKAN